MRKWVLQPTASGGIGLYDMTKGLQETDAIAVFERINCEVADRVVKALNEQETTGSFFS